jgi:hypothetical protein
MTLVLAPARVSSNFSNICQGRKILQRGACTLCYTYLYCILYCICIFWRRPPVTVAASASAMAPCALCLGCTLGTWLCSMSNSIIHHVSCYRFVSQHTYTYHIGPHAHVDTDSDSRQQQQPPAPPLAVAKIIQNNTKSSLLYYVLYVIIVLCIVLCIMYFRSLGGGGRRGSQLPILRTCQCYSFVQHALP